MRGDSILDKVRYCLSAARHLVFPLTALWDRTEAHDFPREKRHISSVNPDILYFLLYFSCDNEVSSCQVTISPYCLLSLWRDRV